MVVCSRHTSSATLSAIYHLFDYDDASVFDRFWFLPSGLKFVPGRV